MRRPRHLVLTQDARPPRRRATRAVCGDAPTELLRRWWRAPSYAAPGGTLATMADDARDRLRLRPDTLAAATAAAEPDGSDQLADELDSGWSDMADAA